MNVRRSMVVAAAILILVSITFLEYSDSKTMVRIGTTTFTAEIADTPISQAKGLSNRETLPETSGMLFVFQEAVEHTFWMQNMKFPLDFVWIRGGKVVGVTVNATPEGEAPTRTYEPPEPVDMVLEVNAGMVDKSGIKVGDSVVVK